jgi:hypothetical protein
MRLGWVAVGATAAVVIVYQLGRARSTADSVARTFTPEGLTQALTRGVDEFTSVGREIAAAMREQEASLTRQLLAPPDELAAARTSTAAARRSRTRSSASVWDIEDDDF